MMNVCLISKQYILVSVTNLLESQSDMTIKSPITYAEEQWN